MDNTYRGYKLYDCCGEEQVATKLSKEELMKVYIEEYGLKEEEFSLDDFKELNINEEYCYDYACKYNEKYHKDIPSINISLSEEDIDNLESKFFLATNSILERITAKEYLDTLLSNSMRENGYLDKFYVIFTEM